MEPRIQYGLVLGVVVAALGYVLAILGMHVNPIMPTVFVGLAMIVNVVCVFMALRATAETAAWGGQFVNALVVGGIGAVLILLGSWSMTALVFPEYYAQMAEATRVTLESANLPEEIVAAQIEMIESTTPFSSALNGAIGALVTSAVAGAIIGAFKRKK